MTIKFIKSSVLLTLLFLNLFILSYVIGFSKLNYFSVKLPKVSLSLNDVKPVTSLNEFNSIIQSSKLTIVDFSKSKCKACERVFPKFQELSQKIDNLKIDFYNVEADNSAESLEILKSQNIRTVPMFILYQNNERIDSILGGHIDEIEELIMSSLPTN